MSKLHLYFIILISILAMGTTHAQTTRIYGKIIDAKTNEPVPFVNVFFKEKNIGTTSSFEGIFALETKNASDTIETSLVGYIPQKIKIKRNTYQEINIQLVPSMYALNEVVIQYEENPAEVLLKKVIKNKEKNDIKGLDAYQYEVYNKIQFDANNITERFKNNRLLHPFKFIFNNMDTSIINGKTYLPAMISEAISDVYYRKSPKASIEIIKGSKISGLKDASISQFLGDMYQKVDIYDNYIMLFEKNFVSPAANFGTLFYKYYLTDSTFIDNQWCYKIMFKPRRPQELTFAGEMWIHDTSFAVKEVDMRIMKDVNINFINDIVVKQKYTLTNYGQWMLSKDQLIVDFNLVLNIKNTLGLYGTKTASYRDFVFNQPKPDKFYNVDSKIITEEDAMQRTDDYWKTMRHDTLNKNEKGIYAMVDSVQSTPIYNTYVNVLRILFTGYLHLGNIEIGNYVTMYSFNSNEGSRFRLSVRTSNDFSKKIKYSAYVAYGTRDLTYKYGGGLLYIFNKNPRRTLALNYKFDTEQLGESEMAFRTDNIAASLLRRNPSNKLTLVREYKSILENEWHIGFMNTLQINHREIFPLGKTAFEFNQADGINTKKNITTSEIELDTRFAKKEKFLTGAFNRTSLGTPFPVIEIKYVKGFSKVFNSDYDYHKLQIGIKQWIYVGTFGWSKYIIEAGQIWGKLPYSLLKLHEGNESLSFDEYSFNLMNYYEFVSDRYFSAYFTHHFDGLFLNKIPLMRKLKWREVAYAKGVIGTLSKENKNFSVFPANQLYTLEQPYYEAGVGIENIFKIIRVDGIWRLSHLDHPHTSKFSIMLTMVISF
ncbi:MAG: DUF5686 family protein [Bacteroidota bacterium]